MKALHFLEHGGLEKLQFGEVETPKPAPGEVLVKVHAAALNRLDLWVLGGWKGLELGMPHIGGSDVAGEIAELGAGVSEFELGARVVLCPGIKGAEDEFTKRGEDSLSPDYKILGEQVPGGFAEFICVPKENIFEIPDNRSYANACAPLLVGLTAWRMLKQQAPVQKGDTVVIVGSGGGLNSFTVQLAASFGAKVIALTSTEDKEEKSLALGAHLAINYKRKPEWGKEVLRVTEGKGAEVVVDNVGQASFPQSLIAVKRGGSIVTVGNTSGPMLSIDNRHIFTKQIKIVGSTMGSAEDFRHLLTHLWADNLKAVVDEVIPLKDGKTGYEKLLAGEQFGKVVLTP